MKKDECIDEALKARQAGDTLTAVNWMRQRKNIDKDFAEIKGQKDVLGQQKVLLERAGSKVDVSWLIPTVTCTILTLQKEAKDNIANVEVVMLDDDTEIQELWESYKKEFRTELYEKLAKLEADKALKKEIQAI